MRSLGSRSGITCRGTRGIPGYTTGRPVVAPGYCRHIGDARDSCRLDNAVSGRCSPRSDMPAPGSMAGHSAFCADMLLVRELLLFLIQTLFSWHPLLCMCRFTIGKKHNPVSQLSMRSLHSKTLLLVSYHRLASASIHTHLINLLEAPRFQYRLDLLAITSGSIITSCVSARQKRPERCLRSDF